MNAKKFARMKEEAARGTLKRDTEFQLYSVAVDGTFAGVFVGKAIAARFASSVKPRQTVVRPYLEISRAMGESCRKLLEEQSKQSKSGQLFLSP